MLIPKNSHFILRDIPADPLNEFLADDAQAQLTASGAQNDGCELRPHLRKIGHQARIFGAHFRFHNNVVL